jgi:DNA-binding GntR family transcriptional regulator
LVSGRLNESQLGTLRDLNGKMWAPELSIVEHAELNNEFHRLIVQFSENRRLLSTYEELNAHLQIARVRYRSSNWRDQRTNIVQEHQDVVDAIAENRGSDAKRLMELHIEASMTRLIEGISESSA